MTRLTNQKKDWKKYGFYGFLLIFLIISLFQVDMNIQRLKNSFERASYIMSDMLPPTFAEPRSLWEASLESIQIAVLGTAFGIVMSLFLCVFAARNLTPHILVSYSVKAFAGFVRAVPALIWALLFIIAVGLGPTAGILALAVNSIGMLVKMYSESIEEIDTGVIEALKVTGASPFQIIMKGVLPTVSSIFTAWSLFRFDINIRYAAILGVVGAGGIGWELVRAARLLNYNEALGITFIIFLIVIISEQFSRYIKKRLNISTSMIKAK